MAQRLLGFIGNKQRTDWALLKRRATMDIDRLIEKYEADHAIDPYALAHGEAELELIDGDAETSGRTFAEYLSLDLAA
jgi:hypothetical protein